MKERIALELIRVLVSCIAAFIFIFLLSIPLHIVGVKIQEDSFYYSWFILTIVFLNEVSRLKTE